MIINSSQCREIAEGLRAKRLLGEITLAQMDRLRSAMLGQRQFDALFDPDRASEGPMLTALKCLGYTSHERFITETREKCERHDVEAQALAQHEDVGLWLRAIKRTGRAPKRSVIAIAKDIGCTDRRVAAVFSGSDETFPWISMHVIRSMGFDSVAALKAAGEPLSQEQLAHEQRVLQTAAMIEALDKDEPFYPRFRAYVRLLHEENTPFSEEAKQIGIPPQELRHIENDKRNSPVATDIILAVLQYYGNAREPEKAWENMQNRAKEGDPHSMALPMNVRTHEKQKPGRGEDAA